MLPNALKSEGIGEQAAANQTASKWQVSCSTIRRWDKLDRKGGWRALMDESRRPIRINLTELSVKTVLNGLVG